MAASPEAARKMADNPEPAAEMVASPEPAHKMAASLELKSSWLSRQWSQVRWSKRQVPCLISFQWCYSSVVCLGHVQESVSWAQSGPNVRSYQLCLCSGSYLQPNWLNPDFKFYFVTFVSWMVHCRSLVHWSPVDLLPGVSYLVISQCI